MNTIRQRAQLPRAERDTADVLVSHASTTATSNNPITASILACTRGALVNRRPRC